MKATLQGVAYTCECGWVMFPLQNKCFTCGNRECARKDEEYQPISVEMTLKNANPNTPKRRK